MSITHDHIPATSTDSTDHEPAQVRSLIDRTDDSEQNFIQRHWRKAVGALGISAAALAAGHLVNGSVNEEPSVKSAPSSSSSSELIPSNSAAQLVAAQEYSGSTITDIPGFAQQNPDSFFNQDISTQMSNLIPFLHSNRVGSLQNYKEASQSNGEPVTDPSEQPTEQLKEAQTSVNNIFADLDTVARLANSNDSAEILLSGVYSPQSAMYAKVLPLVEKFDGSLASNLRDHKVSEASNVFTSGTFGDVHANGYETFVVKTGAGDEQVIQRVKNPMDGSEQDRIIDVMAPSYPKYIHDDLENWQP